MCLPWLVIPFEAPETMDEKAFNFKLSSTQIVVERTFGRLKQMWGFLHQTIKRPNIDFLPQILVAACVLHNICLDFDVGFDIQDIGDSSRDTMEQATAEGGSLSTRNALFRYMQAGLM